MLLSTRLFQLVFCLKKLPKSDLNNSPGRGFNDRFSDSLFREIISFKCVEAFNAVLDQSALTCRKVFIVMAVICRSRSYSHVRGCGGI